MRAVFSLGVAGFALVLSVSLIGGASLPGSALRAAGAFLLFGVLGAFLQLLWQNLTATSAAKGGPQSAPGQPGGSETGAVRAGPGTAAAATAVGAAVPAGPGPGALLNQVLPAASPADLFEPLTPPVVTAKRMEE